MVIFPSGHSGVQDPKARFPNCFQAVQGRFLQTNSLISANAQRWLMVSSCLVDNRRVQTPALYGITTLGFAFLIIMHCTDRQLDYNQGQGNYLHLW